MSRSAPATAKARFNLAVIKAVLYCFAVGSHYPIWKILSCVMCYFSSQDVSKRLSLPMDIHLPPEFLQKLEMENPEISKPLSRMSRRASLVSLMHSRASTVLHFGCNVITWHNITANTGSWFA